MWIKHSDSNALVSVLADCFEKQSPIFERDCLLEMQVFGHLRRISCKLTYGCDKRFTRKSSCPSSLKARLPGSIILGSTDSLFDASAPSLRASFDTLTPSAWNDSGLLTELWISFGSERATTFGADLAGSSETPIFPCGSEGSSSGLFVEFSSKDTLSSDNGLSCCFSRQSFGNLWT